VLTKTSFSTMSRMAADVEFRAPDPDKPMGYRRLVISAISLLTGLGMVYVAMHYIPAILQNPADLTVETEQTEGRDTLAMTSKYGPVLGPYMDAFFIKRTYLEAGQIIQVRYNLPTGSSLDLGFQQCKRSFALEVFKCKPLAEKTINIPNAEAGTREFAFPQTGFYHFDEKVTLPKSDMPYRIVWSRK